MKKQIILGYFLLNTMFPACAMEEEQPVQQTTSVQQIAGEDILNQISSNPEAQQTLVKELAHYWLEQNPNITYSEIVNHYQRTDDNGNRNGNRTSVLPVPLLRAVWDEIKKRQIIIQNRESLQRVIRKLFQINTFWKSILKAKEFLYDSNVISTQGFFHEEFLNGKYDGNWPTLSFVRNGHCVVVTDKNNASALIHLQLPTPKEFFIQVANQLNDFELRNLLQAENVFYFDFINNHIRKNQDRLTTTQNLINTLLNDALDRNQVRFYRDRHQALRDFFQHIDEA